MTFFEKTAYIDLMRIVFSNPAIAEYIGKIGNSFNTETARMFASVLIENFIASQDPTVIKYVDEWGYDWVINLISQGFAKKINTSSKVLRNKPLIVKERKVKPCLGSGWVLSNPNGKSEDLNPWWSRYSDPVEGVETITLTSINKNMISVGVIFVDEMTVDMVTRTKDQIKLNTDTFFLGETLHLVGEFPFDSSIEIPDLLNKSLSIITMAINNPTLFSVCDKWTKADTKTKNKVCELLGIKDQNENSLTQSNSLPTNAIQQLHSTDLAEQVLSVQHSVSTV